MGSLEVACVHLPQVMFNQVNFSMPNHSMWTVLVNTYCKKWTLSTIKPKMPSIDQQVSFPKVPLTHCG